MNRREFLQTSALAPFATSRLNQSSQAAPAPAAGPPLFTTSINVEIMFPRTMPRGERVKALAVRGVKVFSFWRPSAEEQKGMLEAQQQTGLKCSCVVGSGSTGRTTGLTMPGAEQKYFDDLNEGILMAKRFGGADAIVFPGARHLPREPVRRVLVASNGNLPK